MKYYKSQFESVFKDNTKKSHVPGTVFKYSELQGYITVKEMVLKSCNESGVIDNSHQIKFRAGQVIDLGENK